MNDATAYTVASAALRSSFAAAYDGNVDHSLANGPLGVAQRRLEDALKPLEETLANIRHSALTGAQPLGVGANFQEHGFGATAAASEVWSAASDELDRLLSQRIQRAFQKLLLQLAIVAVTLAGAALMGGLVGYGLDRAIRRLTGVMQSLTQNRVDIQVPYVHLRNEVGALAQGLLAFQAALREQAVLEAEIEQERVKAQEQLIAQVAAQSRIEAEARAAEREAQTREAMEKEQASILALATQLETSMSQPIQRLGTSAVQLGACARQMHGLSEHTDAQAGKAAEAAQLAQNGVNTVVPAVEQVSASIQMIASEVNAARAISTDAVQKAMQADQRVESLSNAAKKIGEIVSLIDAIAEQTNLLALNATIEAARAGEAGRGFAVVAGEVKALAGQTAQATREIADQIAAIQSSTDEAVGAIRAINMAISQVNAAAGKIATSINEQTGAIADINRAVGTVASGVQGRPMASSRWTGRRPIRVRPPSRCRMPAKRCAPKSSACTITLLISSVL
ncbi:methyl-accepting chemotaxis protein [Hankyongella ginsenosidimutans]|nr:methyl-accepting chemotaxis protein [Hankyongella ginsenosidimutans]